MHSRNTGGEPELILYCSASDLSALVLFVCTALHPQITCRHSSKFSVMPMSIWKLLNTKQYSPAAHCGSFLSHKSMLASCQADTAPLSVSQYAESVYTMCMHIHPPVFVENFHSRAFLSSLLFSRWSCKSYMWVCQYTGICEAFQGIQDLRNQSATNAG